MLSNLFSLTAPHQAVTAVRTASFRQLLGSNTTTLADITHFMDNFEIVEGATALCDWWVPFVVVPIYFSLIWLVQAWVRYRGKPYELKQTVIVHNLMMSVLSSVLVYFMIMELASMMVHSSFWSVFCDSKRNWSVYGRQIFFYYVNYVFKFIELSDTLLLAFRGNKIPFLHSYHHAATLVLCWSQLRGTSCMQWVVISINLIVHIIMYLYYALYALGYRPWWKKFLTLFQITQFVVSLICCWWAIYYRYIGGEKCSGSDFAASFGVSILTSYLWLFIVLYRTNYKISDNATTKRNLINGRAQEKNPRKASTLLGSTASVASSLVASSPPRVSHRKRKVRVMFSPQ